MTISFFFFFLKVAGIPIEVLRVSTYYKSRRGLSVMNLAAACPTGEIQDICEFHSKCCYKLFSTVKSVALLSTGGVLFTDDVISWHIPRRITPLIDGSFKIVEMHMGINGQRLDKSQMATRGYTLSAREFHIVIEIPIGSPDGYYKVGSV